MNFRTLVLIGMVGVGMVYGESADTQFRNELSDQLEKAISKKDIGLFEQCFAYNDLNSDGKREVKRLQQRIFGWGNAYIKINDPIMGKVDGVTNLNGNYLFDVLISKEPFNRNGFRFDLFGGMHKGKPTILLTEVFEIASPSPQ